MAKIEDGRVSAINKLPAHKRAFVKARSEGKNIRQSAKAANISNSAAYDYDKAPDIQAAYRQLMRAAISPKKLVGLIKGGCEAKMPVYSPDGKKVTERADWKTRKPYIDMAAKHAGYYEEKNPNGGTQIVIAVNHIGLKNATTEHIVEASTEAI